MDLLTTVFLRQRFCVNNDSSCQYSHKNPCGYRKQQKIREVEHDTHLAEDYACHEKLGDVMGNGTCHAYTYNRQAVPEHLLEPAHHGSGRQGS